MPRACRPRRGSGKRPAEAGIGGTTLSRPRPGHAGAHDDTPRRAGRVPAHPPRPAAPRRRRPARAAAAAARPACAGRRSPSSPGMSIDYYIRLEQGRGPHPSRQVLAALARALHADPRRAGVPVPDRRREPAADRPGRAARCRPAIRHLLDSADRDPGVRGRRASTTCWPGTRWPRTSSATCRPVPDADRNMIRWMFRQPGDRRALDRRRDARASPAAPSPTCAPPTPATRAIRGIARAGDRAARHLAPVRRDVGRARGRRCAAASSSGSKHPEPARWSSSARCCTSPDTDQRMIVYCAEPGSPTQAAFRRLAERVAR